MLVGILQDLGNYGFTHPAHFLRGIGRFIVVALGSVGIAVAVCAVSALLLKWLRRDLMYAPTLARRPLPRSVSRGSSSSSPPRDPNLAGTTRPSRWG